jgi:glycosyltransferase involved in cell wall biosynthesis
MGSAASPSGPSRAPRPFMRTRLRRILGAAVHGRAHGRQAREIPAALLDLARSGPTPLASGPVHPGQPLTIATVIPSFRRGSGGHATVVNLMRELRRRGHTVSLWLEDFADLHAGEPPSAIKRDFAEFFVAGDLDLHVTFDHWMGGDVVLATGWQTVPRALLLSGVKARAYLVQDHEPEFYGSSAQALFAETTYREDLQCIAASPWLAELLRNRYGANACHFDLAVDHSTYRPTGERRRDDLVVFYARSETPRRAVPLGLLALEELRRRRPHVEIALFGGDAALPAPFDHTNLGVLDALRLAQLYSRAAVGMVFSLTNPSLVGLEMMACGLVCVELATGSMLSTFGATGPLKLADPNPLSLCAALEQLLDDRALRERMAGDGVAWMQERTWNRAAAQVEAGLRAAFAGHD